MEITNFREIYINEVASQLEICGHKHHFPHEKAFVAETDENLSYYTTIGGTEIYCVTGKIPAGAFCEDLDETWAKSCAEPITTKEQFLECVNTIIERL